MNLTSIGWDLGGAHLKAAGLDAQGQLCVAQAPTPLWLGLHHLETAVDQVLTELNPAPGCRHLVTMTGELADCFDSRAEGVMNLITLMRRHIPGDNLRFFAGPLGFLADVESSDDERRGACSRSADVSHTTPTEFATPTPFAPSTPFATPTPFALSLSKGRPDTAGNGINLTAWESIASANWLATACFAASQIPEALLIDIGSTTTDIVLIHGGQPAHRGYTDQERMRYDELVYTGVVRTPLMAVCSHLPFAGELQPLMAELFATTADIYRLTGELADTADQTPTADGGDKTLTASARRLARNLGSEQDAVPLEDWQRTARCVRERQLARIQHAVERQLSRGVLASTAPVLGAGIGRFLVRDCAARLGHPYRDLTELFPPTVSRPAFSAADCAPAAALACLAARNWMTP